MSYDYDPLTRELVTRLLYAGLPDMYRAADGAPRGRGELRSLLELIGTPLSVLRQNIEELHADLFIDTANDWVIPYLADFVGTTLLFEDPAKNRRDVRETINWRRRKGTPAMLQEMASLLAERTVVTNEGWKLLLMTQELDLLRRDRSLPDITDARISETNEGPLVDTPHLVDVRKIGRRTGKFHPMHVFHWVHSTLLFQSSGTTPADLTDPGDPDLRFAFHPLGELLALRARRTSERDALRTDVVPAQHFAVSPGDWYDVPGRFRVAICGLSAGVAKPEASPRVPNFEPASVAVLDGVCTVSVLQYSQQRFYGRLRIDVVAAPFAGLPPGLPDTNPATIDVRCHVELGKGAGPTSALDNSAPATPSSVVMLRIVPLAAGALTFPGATVEIVGDRAEAAMSASSTNLAREGFLRGGLFVELPATRVVGERWFYVAKDGTVVDAQSAGTGPVDVAVLDVQGSRSLDAQFLLRAGPGPAWPMLAQSRDSMPWPFVPQAPGTGPVVLHGGSVVETVANVVAAVAGATNCAIELALSFVEAGGRTYRPMARLVWQGSDPSAATWTALDDSGASLPSADAHLSDLAALRDEDRPEMRLVVRFVSDVAGATCTPAELAWPSFDGRAVLVHLPQLTTTAVNPVANWPTEAGTFTSVSDAVYVGADGSTWTETTKELARASSGSVAPLRGPTTLRRRVVHFRSLCQWQHEAPPAVMHAATQPGRLDIDVGHGLFAIAASEPPQSSSLGPDGAPAPPNLSVDWQVGYTDHIGALPAPREPLLDRRLPHPTRLVTRSGALHRNAPRAFHDVPRYRTVSDALTAVALSPLPKEVVQIEDSSTYAGESIVWPAGVQSLIIQAAEGERPWLECSTWGIAPGATYQELRLMGLAFGGLGLGELPLPPTQLVQLLLVTVTRDENTLVFSSHPLGTTPHVTRSITSALRVEGDGRLDVEFCVIDAGLGRGHQALRAAEAHVHLDRCTVFGVSNVRVLHASESYFDGEVVVEDRFTGCVRYCRVPTGSILPQQHRTVFDVPARFVSASRHDPGHARMTGTTDRQLLQGAEDGGEIGAFHDVALNKVYRAVATRLSESTPAGLSMGLLRAD